MLALCFVCNLLRESGRETWRNSFHQLARFVILVLEFTFLSTMCGQINTYDISYTVKHFLCLYGA